MSRVIKYTSFGLGGLLLVLALIFVVWARPLLSGVVGFGVKVVCNDLNISRLPREFVLNNIASLLPFGRIDINEDERTVAFYLMGAAIRQASYEPGYGCRTQRSYDTLTLPVHVPTPSTSAIPLSDVSAQYPELNAMLSERFRLYGEGVGEDNPANHRAFIMLHRGKLVAEHYAAPYTATTKQHSMSMAKSINALLWSIADEQGLASLDAPVYAPEWTGDDPRKAITNRDLLHMQSGLERGNYNYAFLTMTATGNNAHFSANRPQAHAPGTYYKYADADSNLSGRSLSVALAKHGLSYQGFASQALFAPIGADSFELANDDYGYHFASSLTYATARDWARVGQLLLKRGQFNDKKIIPSYVFETIKTPLPSSSGRYKFGFWLNHGKANGREEDEFPGLPSDTYSMTGLNGQLLVVIPSLDIVVIHLGNGRGGNAGTGPAVDLIVDAVNMIDQDAVVMPLSEHKSTPQ
ncbi:MAG: serine hydrolase [Pseudomonadota bacterium]